MRFSFRDLLVALSFALFMIALSGCGAYSAHYPFRPDEQNAPASTLPPGVRVAAHLHGTIRVPTEGIPERQYELTIEVEQASDPRDPIWEPVELMNIRVVDDEGREFGAFDVRVLDEPRRKSTGPSATPANRQYLVIFQVSQAYKFESILRVTVAWKLRAAGQPPIKIKSSFIR